MLSARHKTYSQLARNGMYTRPEGIEMLSARHNYCQLVDIEMLSERHKTYSQLAPNYMSTRPEVIGMHSARHNHSQLIGIYMLLARLSQVVGVLM